MSEYTQMDKDVKAAWVAALRSGEFDQVKSQLRYCDGYCCLGVLTDIYIDTHAGLGSWDGIFFRWDEDEEVKREAVELALPVREWSGLICNGTGAIDIDSAPELMAMNDEQDKSFIEIADWIEANL